MGLGGAQGTCISNPWVLVRNHTLGTTKLEYSRGPSSLTVCDRGQHFQGTPIGKGISGTKVRAPYACGPAQVTISSSLPKLGNYAWPYCERRPLSRAISCWCYTRIAKTFWVSQKKTTASSNPLSGLVRGVVREVIWEHGTLVAGRSVGFMQSEDRGVDISKQRGEPPRPICGPMLHTTLFNDLPVACPGTCIVLL